MSGDKGDELSSIADDLTRRIIEAIIKVHQTLGPGFVEGIYHRALIVELKRRALRIDSEADVQIYYEDELVGRHRLDLVVEGRVIVELKVVEGLSRAHYAQVRSYLRATRLQVALLVNFSGEKADYRRIEYA